MATSSQDLKLQLTTNTSVAQPQDQETSLSTDTSMDQSQEHEPMIRGERTNQSFVTRSRRHEDKECFTRGKSELLLYLFLNLHFLQRNASLGVFHVYGIFSVY